MGLYQSDESVRKQIDKRLHKIAIIEGDLGCDSTKRQFTTAKARQHDLIEQIKELDEEFYNVINP